MDLAAAAVVNVLEVVDDARDVDGAGHVVGLEQELDLSVDVVLDETVYRLNAAGVRRQRPDAVLQVRRQEPNTVLDAGGVGHLAGQGVVGGGHGAAPGVTDDDGRLGAGVD